MSEIVEIVRLGGSGDGIAETGTGRLHVAGALPGERVMVERAGERGRLLSVEIASPDRVEPFCPYFGRCGGCAAQHMAPGLYRAWKRDKVAVALRSAGVAAEPADLVDAHGAGRRRVVFHAREQGGAPGEGGTPGQGGARMAVGFMAARSHDLVEIAACPVTEPRLAGAPAAATALAAQLGSVGKPLDVAVVATPAGLDIDLRGTGPLGEKRRQRLIALAGELDLARLSLHGEVLIERRRPVLAMGPAAVAVPPGGFLQATEAGEEALGAAVVDSCAGARRIVDLFAGSGPLTLRLARTASVHAVELDGAALAALDRAAREATGLRGVTTEARDLFRRPLLPIDLTRFDAVVLDPPRAGADAQVRQLMTASPDTVVMVSCDPGTFARDAATLAAGGFVAERVVPVDQFKWSAHVELVGTFRRAKAGRRRRR